MKLCIMFWIHVYFYCHKFIFPWHKEGIFMHYILSFSSFLHIYVAVGFLSICKVNAFIINYCWQNIKTLIRENYNVIDLSLEFFLFCTIHVSYLLIFILCIVFWWRSLIECVLWFTMTFSFHLHASLTYYKLYMLQKLCW